MSSLIPSRIQTRRLVLREPVVADASAIFRSYAQDPVVCRFMVWRPHESEATTIEFVESCKSAWRSDERRPFVITEKGSDTAIGMIEARFLGTTVDIGYVLARPHWNKGFMPEAIRALADLCLASPGIFRVHACCDTENVPSQRVLEKAGFVCEGRLDRYGVHPNISAEPRACFMYAKCR